MRDLSHIFPCTAYSDKRNVCVWHTVHRNRRSAERAVKALRKLCDLRDGEWGRVVSVDENCPLRRRLTELGFIEGTRVKRLFTAAAGDPAAYRLRGTVIALRKSDSAAIAVESTMKTRKHGNTEGAGDDAGGNRKKVEKAACR